MGYTKAECDNCRKELDVNSEDFIWDHCQEHTLCVKCYTKSQIAEYETLRNDIQSRVDKYKDEIKVLDDKIYNLYLKMQGKPYKYKEELGY